MSMTLEEAIEQVERMHKESRSGWLYALKRGETIYAERCKKSMDEFRQLAEWLKELAERRKQSEIIHCKDCRWNDGVCYCEFHYRDVKPTDYCSWAERRTNDSV